MTRFSNPTGTGNIERAARGEIARKWQDFTTKVTTQLYRANRITTNSEAFVMSPGQIRTFMVYLDTQINEILLATGDQGHWMDKYILQGYERGLNSARQALLSQGAQLSPTFQEALDASVLDPSSFTATPSIDIGSIGFKFAPIHQDALEFLFTRSYESLEGWTSAMSRQVRQILMGGIEEGQGIAEVIRNIRKRIDVSQSRAKLVAQTEIIQAYQRSNINEAKRAGEELQTEIQMRWLTRRDSLVRHMHANWHGILMTVEEAFKRIGLSPWNCRCALTPVIPEADTEAKREKFKEERRVLLELEAG